jgi:hypothetical protein
MSAWLIVVLSLLSYGQIIPIIKHCAKSYFGLVQEFATTIITAIDFVQGAGCRVQGATTIITAIDFCLFSVSNPNFLMFGENSGIITSNKKSGR